MMWRAISVSPYPKDFMTGSILGLIIPLTVAVFFIDHLITYMVGCCHLRPALQAPGCSASN